MKKILITGGSGFIGTNLCFFLLKKNYEIICLDNHYSSSKKNIKFLLKNKNFKYIKQDVKKKITLKVDEIYNLACPASPVAYQNDPIYTLETNIYGTQNMLELAKKNNAKLLQASTSEVYGDPKINPQPETYWGNVNTLGKRSCYDEGKRVAETMCYEYKKKYGLNIKIARIFNTYGPNMAIDDGRVISNFIVQSLLNKAITIYGKGKQTRSFCHVNDLLNGLTKLMNLEKKINTPINLGNNFEISVIEVAKLIKKLCSSKSKIIFKALPENDPSVRNPELKLAKKLLKWEPTTSLDTGLKNTINYFKKVVL